MPIPMQMLLYVRASDGPLLGLRQNSNDLCVQICYDVHVASVGTQVPERNRIRQVRGLVPRKDHTANLVLSTQLCQYPRERKNLTLLCI